MISGTAQRPSLPLTDEHRPKTTIRRTVRFQVPCPDHGAAADCERWLLRVAELHRGEIEKKGQFLAFLTRGNLYPAADLLHNDPSPAAKIRGWIEFRPVKNADF